jgi:hypothetical protein
VTSQASAAANNDRPATADYRWTCEVHTTDAQAVTAEWWLRAIWEGAPTALRWFLRCGWQLGLGLRLGPPDASHILGWHIKENTGKRVSVEARSRIVNASNTLTTFDDRIRWATEVGFENVLGRLVWAPARVIHQQLIPWSVRRAIRSRGSS